MGKLPLKLEIVVDFLNNVKNQNYTNFNTKVFIMRQESTGNRMIYERH